MAEELIEFFYNDRKEALRILSNGDFLVPFMTRETPICPLIGSKIKSKSIGEGVYGKVFKITFPGNKSKNYALKKSKVSIIKFYPDGKTTYGQVADEYDLSVEDLIHFNCQVNRSEMENKITESCGDTLKSFKTEKEDFYNYGIDKMFRFEQIRKEIFVPLFLSDCRWNGKRIFKRVDNQKKIVLSPGDFVCDANNTEFAISLLVSENYRKEKSINFLDVFDFATCSRSGNDSENKSGRKYYTTRRGIHQYTFMELVDMSFANYMHTGYNAREVDILLFQILHAITIYQKEYKIVHGDLHLGNIFLEEIKKTSKWKDQSLNDANYFEYVVNGKSFFYRRAECDYIVKIGDWGLACKYSEPRILHRTIMENGMDHLDGIGSWVPNFYDSNYDPNHVVLSIIKLGIKTTFLKKVMTRLLGAPHGTEWKEIHPFERMQEKYQNSVEDGIIEDDSKIDKKYSILNLNTGRPDIKLLQQKSRKFFDLESIFRSESTMKMFLITPPEGSKIVRLGEV